MVFIEEKQSLIALFLGIISVLGCLAWDYWFIMLNCQAILDGPSSGETLARKAIKTRVNGLAKITIFNNGKSDI